MEHLWPEVMTVDFFTAVPKLDLPVYFFAGRYDFNSPSLLTERYHLGLYAPAGKHLVWFEDSAHDIFFDELDRLVAEILAILEAQPRNLDFVCSTVSCSSSRFWAGTWSWDRASPTRASRRTRIRRNGFSLPRTPAESLSLPCHC